MNALIRLLYALLLAVSVVIFVGVTIYSFYPSPKYQPSYTNYNSSKQSEYENNYNIFQNKQKAHDRNVATALVPLAVLIVLAGVYLLKRSDVIGEGIALGGIATSIYAVIVASMADARVLRFLSVSVLLLGALLLVQRRFLVVDTSKDKV